MDQNGTPEVVVITGASAGVGRATAVAFAKRGSASWPAGARDSKAPGQRSSPPGARRSSCPPTSPTRKPSKPRHSGSSTGGDTEEGAFLPCSFWLTECLARQGRIEDPRGVFDRTVATGDELALFSEEYDPKTDEALGNFPQALTHLSHIAAAVALSEQREHPQ